MSAAVLDLDETLIHSIHSSQLRSHENRRSYEEALRTKLFFEIPEQNGKIYVFIRNYALEFIIRCHYLFEHVIIWSAGLEGYVNAIADYLYSQIRALGYNYSPSLVLNRDHCRTFSFRRNEFYNDFINLNKFKIGEAFDRRGRENLEKAMEAFKDVAYYYKPLRDLVDIASIVDIQLDENKILFIDDNNYTFKDDPSKGVVVTPFNINNFENDPALGSLTAWMESEYKQYADNVYMYDISLISKREMLFV